MSTLASPSPVKKKTPEKDQVAAEPEKKVEKPAFVAPSPKQPKRVGDLPADKQAKATVGKERDKKIKPPFSVPNLYWRLAIAGALALILIGGIFFSSTKLEALVLEIEKKRGQMVALQEKEESLRLLSVVLASLQEEIPIVEKGLPNEQGIVDFIKEVGNLGEKVAIESLSFNSDQPQLNQAGDSYIEWTIEASGSLADVEEFLGKILSLPILISPKVIDIDNIDEETSKLVLRAWLYADPNFFPEGE